MDNETVNTYTIGKASELLKTPKTTLRRLCNSGLIPYIHRNLRGYYILNEEQINHTKLILELKQSGVKKSELKRYTKLFREGKDGLPKRKALLETQKRQLWQELERCQQGIDFIERQIELIDQELE